MRRIFLLLFTLVLFFSAPAFAEEHPRWSGVDETVVERFARDFGREPQDPLFDTDQGDLLLFLFALAGALGGFVMGYYWHKLFVAKQDLEQSK
jgi:cobalt/nickel transport protein